MTILILMLQMVARLRGSVQRLAPSSGKKTFYALLCSLFYSLTDLLLYGYQSLDDTQASWWYYG